MFTTINYLYLKGGSRDRANRCNMNRPYPCLDRLITDSLTMGGGNVMMMTYGSYFFAYNGLLLMDFR